MYGKTALVLAFVASCVAILYFYGSSTPGFEFFRLPVSTAPKMAEAYIPPCRSESPLKVYMYDLPPKFNVGMFHSQNSSAEDGKPVTTETLPPWPWKSGLSRQHSVEYWMMASLLYDSRGRDEAEGREAIRVSDPEIADAFFVPFFSSLSFNIHGHHMNDPETEEDKKLQVTVMFIFSSNRKLLDRGLFSPWL